MKNDDFPRALFFECDERDNEMSRIKKSTELAVITSWATLPAAIKIGIMAMVRAEK